MRILALLAHIPLVAILSACPGPTPPDEVQILSPEPAGAPTESADGRLSCLGSNEPLDAVGTGITLPGWARTLADPTNTGDAQPAARVDVFDASGAPLGTAFSDTSNGRVAVSVSVRSAGFDGWVEITATGYIDMTFFSSRRITSDAVAGWVWLTTPEERDSHAAASSITLEAGTGILVGAVHDCVVFGTANVVIRYGGDRTDGVVYFNGFDPAPGDTFTSASGRFAIANLPPGPLVVDAFGRLMPGEPLILLSRADVTITADEITVVDLQPRAGVDR